jgi:hypothetical protein
MRLLKENVKTLYRLPLKLKAQNTIVSFHEENETFNLLINALKASLENDVTPVEKIWIAQIERLRKAFNSSSKKISIQDYGAGDAKFNLSENEMEQGRTIIRTVREVCLSNSKPYFWSFFLFKLIRELKPSTCLELGTCLGISAAFQATALKLNQSGQLITLEGSEMLASLAKEGFQLLNLDNVQVVVGRFQDTLNQVLHQNTPIDYAFIDGHHDEKATWAYYEQILPFLAAKSVLVFDDISWSTGMQRAWQKIETDPRVKFSLDLSQVGVCIISDQISTKQSYKLTLI